MFNCHFELGGRHVAPPPPRGRGISPFLGEALSGDRRMVHEYKGIWPKLGARVYGAEGAQIVGDVGIGDHSSVWYHCVIRGEVYYVHIRHKSTLQDRSIGQG